MPEEQKQPNKSNEVRNNPNFFDVSSSSIFKDNVRLVYLYKKTEKVISAIYLISNFISDKEPIKWQMRDECLTLLSSTLPLNSIQSQSLVLNKFNLSFNSFNFVSLTLKLLALLEVSYIAGLITEMNFNILKQELEHLVKVADLSESSCKIGPTLSEHFFEVNEEKDVNNPEANQNQTGNSLKSHTFYKGHNLMSDSMSFRKVTTETVRPSELKQKDKLNRQEIILSLLKKKGDLGIKDFTLSINGCSEKTIQRELAILVSKGQIKKIGEKRWSRYSLVA